MYLSIAFIIQVVKRSSALFGLVAEGDEIVSVNGSPCSDMDSLADKVGTSSFNPLDRGSSSRSECERMVAAEVTTPT